MLDWVHKAVPLQVWSDPEVSRKLRFSDYMTTAQDGGKVVSLTHRPTLPQEIFLVLFSVRGWVDPSAIVRWEWLCQWIIPMTPAGIEPSTFQFVAQHINHCATAVPNRNEYQEYFQGGKCGRCLGLTTLPHSCANYLETWERQTPGTLRACPGLQRDYFYNCEDIDKRYSEIWRRVGL